MSLFQIARVHRYTYISNEAKLQVQYYRMLLLSGSWNSFERFVKKFLGSLEATFGGPWKSRENKLRYR